MILIPSILPIRQILPLPLILITEHGLLLFLIIATILLQRHILLPVRTDQQNLLILFPIIKARLLLTRDILLIITHLVNMILQLWSYWKPGIQSLPFSVQ